jgi:glutaminyl-peptide cyclotransferase
MFVVLGFSCRNENSNRTSSVPNNSARNGNAQPNANSSAPRTIPTQSYEVVNSWPHDPQAFTQGLVFHNGALLESTGQQGRSTVRRVNLTTGEVIQQVNLPSEYFGEGMTVLNGKIYQVTWENERGFIYNAETLRPEGNFSYQGEGWGLTNDGRYLILSDGSNQLRFLDPSNFRVVRTINVSENGLPLRELNELEYIRGEIYANVWHRDRIARIDANDGRILGWIDLTGLLPADQRPSDPEAVLNGIAFDENGNRLFVTGKLWPRLFEIRLRDAPR